MRQKRATAHRETRCGFVVLIVADDYADLASLSVTLHFSGYEVHLAPDWSTALGVVRETLPEVVLFNLTQANPDSIERVEQLRSEAERNHAKGAPRPLFLGCGQSADQAARFRSYFAGIDAQLGWPLDVAELRTVLLQFHMRDRRGSPRPIRTLHRRRQQLRFRFRPIVNEGRGMRRG